MGRGLNKRDAGGCIRSPLTERNKVSSPEPKEDGERWRKQEPDQRKKGRLRGALLFTCVGRGTAPHAGIPQKVERRKKGVNGVLAERNRAGGSSWILEKKKRKNKNQISKQP